MKASGHILEKTAQVVCACVVIMIGFLGIQNSILAASANANVLFILDGSGSMWGRLEGDVEKIVIAKERMTELVQELRGVNMGLIVYGHRRKGDCDDIEIMVPLGAGNQDVVIQQIQSINPKGKTPITRSIALAAQQLETIEEETEIVLVSDGLETCDDDPCGYVKTLKDKGIKFRLDVVGFDVSDEEREQLECIAKAGGGRYFSAQNTIQLKEAFTEVKTEVIKKVETKSGPKAGDVWTEPVTGVEFVWIPEGCFQMGQTEDEKRDLLHAIGEETYNQWSNRELPRHQVCLDGFWMGRYEVTNAQYRKWKASHDSKGYEGRSTNDDTQPAVYVSWEDANAFTEWLTQHHTNQYIFRLPTEAEWEYAARAGTTTIWYWGNDPNEACRYANVHDQTSNRINPFDRPHQECDDGYAVAAPVGSFHPNPFGLYDMLGNVWEHCQDWYESEYYSKSSGKNPQGPPSGSKKVGRGGGWNAYVWYSRPAYRNGVEPTSDGNGGVGFRLVRMP